MKAHLNSITYHKQRTLDPMRCSRSYKGKQLPWTQLLCDDMRSLIARGAECPQQDPIEHATQWRDWLMSESAAKAIQRLHFVESILDDRKSSLTASTPTKECRFACPQCDSKFASQKALGMHSRIKHGIRSPVNALVPGSVCPACKKDFHVRVRCLNHLSDHRRPAC